VRKIHFTIVLAALLMARGSQAEVLAASPGGFSLTHEVLIEATREEVWRAAVNDIGRWWSSDHTISGDAANLSIDAVPQGCFCEAIGEHAGVVHLTVTFVNPNVMLRLTGGSMTTEPVCVSTISSAASGRAGSTKLPAPLMLSLATPFCA
jgi:hypothetical protein